MGMKRKKVDVVIVGGLSRKPGENQLHQTQSHYVGSAGSNMTTRRLCNTGASSGSAGHQEGLCCR